MGRNVPHFGEVIHTQTREEIMGESWPEGIDVAVARWQADLQCQDAALQPARGADMLTSCAGPFFLAFVFGLGIAVGWILFVVVMML